MSDSAKLVERQLRMVEIKRQCERAGARSASVKVDEVHYGPCVLLSCESGSEGDEVARLLGDRLRWQVFHRELVNEIAERAHVRKQLVESVDEHVRSRWIRLLHPLRERAELKPESYLYYLHEVVLALGHHGNVIIVGRGAQYLLPAECAVRVRIVEPQDVRAARVSAFRNVTAAQGIEFVRHRDAERAAFIQQFFHQDTTLPANYDLVLNTHSLGVSTAVEIVLTALDRKLGVHGGPAPCAT